MIKESEVKGLLVKTTLVDYPSTVATAFFLKGCNLRCPYCYNTELVLPEKNEESASTLQFSTLEELYAHLEKRKNVIKGFVLSGGEALLNPLCFTILKKAKSLGYKTKLDTNGTLPEKLEELLGNKEAAPDYIALDVKTSPEKYSLLSKENSKKFEENIVSSIKILSSLKKENREFRTVLVPHLVEKKDIEIISTLLPENATWYLSHFQNNSCLDKAFEKISAYSQEEENDLLSEAKIRIKDTFLR